ncbi:response regulator [bacterium]|nr:response regulator [bacterium]
MDEKILFVDDDVNLLSSMQRQLRKQFDLDTAVGPEEGLTALNDNGPYAVIVSDLRMPGMDGIQLLAKVRSISPNTIRVMLTGNADLDSAMSAVNEGHIFRFIAKPIQPEMLAKILEASIEQYRLVTAEQTLLRNTLSGCVRMMTEVMSIVSPEAFSQSARLAKYVSHVARKLEIQDAWQFELAAMLSQIGCVATPQALLRKAHTGMLLTAEEQSVVRNQAAVAHRMLAHIPRLEQIADIVASQQDTWQPQDVSGSPTQQEVIKLGAQLLRASLDFDNLVNRGVSIGTAVRTLSHESSGHDPAIIAALASIENATDEQEITAIQLDNAKPGMVLAQDVIDTSGKVIGKKGQEVTNAMLERLRNEATDPQSQAQIYVLAA